MRIGIGTGPSRTTLRLPARGRSVPGTWEAMEALRLQAAACDNLGSPFHGALLRRAADDLDAGGPVGALLDPWAQADLKALFDDAVPLRLLGGLHDLVLSGEDPALAARVHPDAPEIWAQVVWARDNEWAETADDVLRRRTTLTIRGLATDEVRAARREGRGGPAR